jgi:hypothetical protein
MQIAEQITFVAILLFLIRIIGKKNPINPVKSSIIKLAVAEDRGLPKIC